MTHVRRTLVASSTASLAVFAVTLLYVDPWGVPRVVAGVLLGSLVVAVAAGKILKYRCDLLFPGPTGRSVSSGCSRRRTA